MENFRFKGIWQWNPVSCVGSRGYDERHMLAHNDWFFDRAFWDRYFDAMLQAGLNTWVLANTHPFPFMVDLVEFPDAKVLSDSQLARYQDHYHLLFAKALEKQINPLVLFHTCYVPEKFGIKYNINPEHSYEPPELAYEYTRYCVKQLCDTYPELPGIYAEASENVKVDQRAEFANKAIVAGIHESGQRPMLFFRGWISEPSEMNEKVAEAYEGDAYFNVKYTWEHLVSATPDPEFMRWVDTCGAERVMAEFWISNFQPFGCHDLELAKGLRESLKSLGCSGFTSHPMDLYGAPFVQGGDKLQLDRDRDWFATLSGKWNDGYKELSDEMKIGNPKSLKKMSMAAALPMINASYYMTGNKQNFIQSQLMSMVAANPEKQCELQLPRHWKTLRGVTECSFGVWMEQLENKCVQYPGDEHEGYSIQDLIDDQNAILAKWKPRLEQFEREGTGPLWELWKTDVTALYHISSAWVRHVEGLSHLLNEENNLAIECFTKAMSSINEISGILGYDGPYRLLVGRHTITLSWSEIAAALALLIEDLSNERELRESYLIGSAEIYETGSDVFMVEE